MATAVAGEDAVRRLADGPVWQQVLMGRAAHPDDTAPTSYVFFAAEQLSSYYIGEVLAPIGEETLPG
jgi:hypothetical protein